MDSDHVEVETFYTFCDGTVIEKYKQTRNRAEKKDQDKFGEIWKTNSNFK